MGFIVMIPAHSCSKRLPGKLLADICGLPMIIRVAKRAEKSEAERILIVTCDKKIQEISIQHGFESIFTKSSHTTGTDRLSEAVSRIDLPDNKIIINLQGDEPLIEPNLINKISQKIENTCEYDIVTPACSIEDEKYLFNSNVVKVVCNTQGKALYFSRANIPWKKEIKKLDFSKKNLFFRHIGLYAYRAKFLRQFSSLPNGKLEQLESLEQLRAMEHGYNIFVYHTQLKSSFSVDNASDLEHVRNIYRNSVA